MNGKGEITVRTAFDPVLSIASLRVADNGPGISARDSEHLFEPYYSRTPGGAGLGLTIVSAIISDHNGFIRVRSEVGKGAEFVLELPVRRGRAAGSE
jgi:two-component system nitrogen regulation sensor histidine kinase NtrY